MISEERAEDLMPGDLARQAVERIETTKARYIEEMAASFILKTGVPADQCVLVQEQLPWPQIGWRFYFEKR